MTNRILYIWCLATVVLAAPLHAQQDTVLHRTVIVENEYNPRPMDANKLNVLPRVEEPAPVKQQICYAREEAPFNAFGNYVVPNRAPLPQQQEGLPGWAELGYGNEGNLTIGLGYLFRPGTNDRLLFSATLEGENSERELSADVPEWKSRFYRTSLNGEYRHQLRTGEFGLRGNLGLEAFNYLPAATMVSDKQQHTTGGIDFFFRSDDTEQAWRYAAEAGVNYFGQEYLYTEQAVLDGRSEVKLHVAGNLSYHWDTHREAGVNLSIAHFLYSSEESESATTSLLPFKDYTLIRLNPYYAWTMEKVRLRVGAQIDWATGFDNGVNLAPDLRMEVPLGERSLFYMQAVGGTRTADFRYMSAVTPYWAVAQQLKNTHVKLDGTAGLRFGFPEGVNLHLYGGYEWQDNDLLVTPLNEGANLLVQDKANALKLGVSTRYAFRDLLTLSAQGEYRSWSTEDESKPLLYTKPKLDCRLEANGKIGALNWGVGYRYIGRYEQEMKAVNNLYLNLSYTWMSHIVLWAKADNLLNRSYQYYWGYPAESLNFLIGAGIRF